MTCNDDERDYEEEAANRRLLEEFDPEEFEELHDMCQPIGCDMGVHLPGCKYDVHPSKL